MMGQSMAITADSRLVNFNVLTLQYQDEAYTLAYYLLGDENRAEKATQAAFNHLYRNGGLHADRFRLEVLRRILSCCQDGLGRLHNRVRPQTERGTADPIFGQLSGLKDNERSVVVLVDVLGLDYDETAQVLGSTKKQVSSLLAQARLNFGQGEKMVQ